MPDAATLSIGQALADVATIGLLQQRAIHRSDTLTEQLQTALNSRILIEQAKGVLAERLQLEMVEAFTLLRGSARSRNLRLSELARPSWTGRKHSPARRRTGRRGGGRVTRRTARPEPEG